MLYYFYELLLYAYDALHYDDVPIRVHKVTSWSLISYNIIE